MAIRRPYHSARVIHNTVEAPAVLRHHDTEGNITFVHDLFESDTFPEEFDMCDVLYTEMPWTSGFTTFEERAGKSGRTFSELLARVNSLVVASGKPTCLVVGKAMLRHLTPTLVMEVGYSVHGMAPAQLALYDLVVPRELRSELEVIEWLATQYECVGDFMCGYGRTGLTFAEAGKNYIMADYNPLCVGFIANERDKNGND